MIEFHREIFTFSCYEQHRFVFTILIVVICYLYSAFKKTELFNCFKRCLYKREREIISKIHRYIGTKYINDEQSFGNFVLILIFLNKLKYFTGDRVISSKVL